MEKMPREQLRVFDNTAEMIVDDLAVSTVAVDDFVKLYIVSYGNSLYHGDEPFYVAICRDRLWVIPYFTPGVDQFLQAVTPRLDHEQAIFKATSPPRPFAWRRRLGGFLPLFPLPRLAEHPLSTLPAWQESGPFRLSEIPEFDLE